MLTGSLDLKKGPDDIVCEADPNTASLSEITESNVIYKSSR